MASHIITVKPKRQLYGLRGPLNFCKCTDSQIVTCLSGCRLRRLYAPILTEASRSSGHSRRPCCFGAEAVELHGLVLLRRAGVGPASDAWGCGVPTGAETFSAALESGDAEEPTGT